MKRRSYTCRAWCNGDVAGIVEVDVPVAIVDDDGLGAVGKEMGLGSGSVGSATVVGWRMQGVGSGADSERDRLENKKSRRPPDRSVVLKIRFFRRRVEGVVVSVGDGVDSCAWSALGLVVLVLVVVVVS